MAVLHLPSAAETASDASSSTPRYTPVSSDSSDIAPASQPVKSPIGPLRLQTNFEDAGSSGPVSDVEDPKVDNSGDELGGKNARVGSAPKYTPEEEREVVRVFDRRLVPFLALLYMLSFLDRSSMFGQRFPVNSSCTHSSYASCRTMLIYDRYWKCEDSWTARGPSAFLGTV